VDAHLFEGTMQPRLVACRGGQIGQSEPTLRETPLDANKHDRARALDAISQAVAMLWDADAFRTNLISIGRTSVTGFIVGRIKTSGTNRRP
jgi:hypothetical protein